MSPDSCIDDEDMGRLEIPDQTGHALGSLPGIEDLKFQGSAFP